MRKLSVPIHLNTINEKSLPVFLDLVKKCQAERVFICGFGLFYDKESILYTDTEKVKRAISFFQEKGFETAAWVNSFGHGIVLKHDDVCKEKNNYTKIEGINGDYVEQVYCPLDERFVADYQESIKKLAALGPDIIMLDDDFRINSRKYYMGCFCPLHLKEYYKRLGEEIPRENLEQLIFTGGKNKYRTTYMELMKDSLLGFAKKLREAVDEVDETIRLGAASTHDNWDFSGTDSIEIANAFAGKTKPFVRTAGAPYWKEQLSRTMESTRMQVAWCKEADVEVFAEGDVYPRPRYNVPAKQLELMDFALIADGKADGILKYVFDYAQAPEYESGYVDRHVRNADIREKLAGMFEGKETVGVRAFHAMHKVEAWNLSKELDEVLVKRLTTAYKSTADYLLTRNTIPTTYEASGYPIYICGENAKYVSKEDLKQGAILDAVAAKILSDRGIDTGIYSEETASFEGEYYRKQEGTIRNINKDVRLKKLICKEQVEILSVFLPDETPAAYLYENAEGIRFCVYAHDIYASRDNANYFNNYYRQEQLYDAINWVGRKKLPVANFKNPCLYVIAAKGENTMSVAVFNIFMDDVYDAKFVLDEEYKEITCLNTSGVVEKDSVTLSEIASYGFVAFEVKK